MSEKRLCTYLGAVTGAGIGTYLYQKGFELHMSAFQPTGQEVALDTGEAVAAAIAFLVLHYIAPVVMGGAAGAAAGRVMDRSRAEAELHRAADEELIAQQRTRTARSVV